MLKRFTHLHLHSQYSLLDGMITSDKLLERCKELGMESVAITDHGNLFGTIEFYTKALAAGIKPIIGIEAYIAPGSRFHKAKSGIRNAAYHLVLLAENNVCYQNLLKLASVGYTEGFYYRPRIDKQILSELNKGLICLSGCLKGEITSLLIQGNEQGAMAAAESYVDIFGADRFFIEVQNHEDNNIDTKEGLIGPANKIDVQGGLVDLANKMGLGLVATNDVHFLNEDDYEAHNCLCCISTRRTADDPDRIIYPKDVWICWIWWAKKIE